MGRPGVMLYFDIREGMEQLEPAQRCAVYDAIMDYAQLGELPRFDDPVARAVWALIRPRIDKDQDAYEKRRTRRRRAKEEEPEDTGTNWSDQTVPDNSVPEQKREEKKTTEKKTTHLISTDRENGAASQPVKNTFTPPSLENVREYCLAQKLIVDPQQFLDYYTANGWNMGRCKMADWKAALRSWDKTNKEKKYGKGNIDQSKLQALGTIGIRL